MQHPLSIKNIRLCIIYHSNLFIPRETSAKKIKQCYYLHRFGNFKIGSFSVFISKSISSSGLVLFSPEPPMVLVMEMGEMYIAPPKLTMPPEIVPIETLLWFVTKVTPSLVLLSCYVHVGLGFIINKVKEPLS
jgi:hypothetical protein